MGRRKIDIQPILDDRNRSVTFLKRKNGLFKKAYELGVLCGAEVALIVFSGNGKLYEYSSGDLNATLLRYSSHDGQPYEHRSPRDYEHVKSTIGQASNAPPVDDDEDLSDDIDLDENERKPMRNGPGNAGSKVSNLATTVPWSSAFPAPDTLPSWSYHDDASSSRPPTSIGKFNHLLQSPSPSLVSFADLPGSPGPSPRAFPFRHSYPTTAGGLNQTHTMTMAMLPIPPFNSAEAASAINNNYMLRHPPYITDEPSWAVRSSSVLLPESISSTCQTPALEETDHSMGLSETADLKFSTLTSPARARILGSGIHPPMTPNSFSCMPSPRGISTGTSRSAHGSSSSISYYRHHKEAYRFDSVGVESAEYGEQRGHGKGRASESPGKPLYSQKESCSGSGIPSSHPNQESPAYANQSGALVSTTNGFLPSFSFDPKSMSVNDTPAGLNHPFQWPSTSTAGEASVPADAIGMQWSNSRSHSPCLFQNPLLP